MKTILFSVISIATIFLLFFSCQKEVSFDNGQVSDGALEKDVNDNCLAPITHGNYIAGKNLDESNYIDAKVHITNPGAYSISSDTINGYSFNATGNFKDTGVLIVRIAAHGKPIAAGSNLFQITYGASNCSVSVTVLDSRNTASFTVKGSPGVCMNDSIIGGYVKGFALDTGNRVLISVDVTVPGTYSISSNVINGYSFSSLGSFSATGVQTVDLSASGIPINAGTDVFTVSTGSSSCTFSIPVLAAVAATNNDLFPLTMSSYWNYNDFYYSGSTVKTEIIDTARLDGNLYRIMEEQGSPIDPQRFYYRKSGPDYFEYTRVDKYTGSFKYNKPIYDAVLFLSENLSTGSKWQSKEYSDTASFGQVIGLRYAYSCLEADVASVINGKAFTHVYKVQMNPQIEGASNSFGNTGEVYTYYYARGVGLIYYKESNIGSNYGERQISNWLVN